MVVVKNFLGLEQVVFFNGLAFGAVLPRKSANQFQKIPGADVLRRVGIHHLELGQLAFDAFLYFALKLERLDFFLELLVVVDVSFRVGAKLLLD